MQAGVYVRVEVHMQSWALVKLPTSLQELQSLLGKLLYALPHIA